MFGSFSIHAGEKSLSNINTRSKKMWILLGYLIYQKGRTVPKKELIHLLWGDVTSLANPENTLKITFHRLRNLLNQLWAGAGHELIIFHENGYAWNISAPAVIDTEEFDKLYAAECENEEIRIQTLLRLHSLYTSDFLSDFSQENWITPIATHYHSLYINVVLEVIPLLAKRNKHEQIIHICHKAMKFEPYHEQLHLHLMQSLVELNNREQALTVYKQFSRNLFHDFGFRPGKEIRNYYRLISTTLNTFNLSIQNIINELSNSDSSVPLQCDYEHFLILCNAKARAITRYEHITHIALISIIGRLDNKPLPAHSLKRNMSSLADSIQLILSPDHVYSQCSGSQYVILLPYENYENSCTLCRKIVTDYAAKHSRSVTQLCFEVQQFFPGFYNTSSP